MVNRQQQSAAPTLKRKAQKYAAIGDWANAEATYRVLCEILSDTLGADHLEVAMALHQLAFVLEAQGKTDEATAVREQTSEILLSQKPSGDGNSGDGR